MKRVRDQSSFKEMQKQKILIDSFLFSSSKSYKKMQVLVVRREAQY